MYADPLSGVTPSARKAPNTMVSSLTAALYPNTPNICGLWGNNLCSRGTVWPDATRLIMEITNTNAGRRRTPSRRLDIFYSSPFLGPRAAREVLWRNEPLDDSIAVLD